MEKAQGLGTFLKKMKIKKKIKDINNKDYVITDLKKFINHIKEFHGSGETIHEENGYYFLVNNKFRENLFKLLK